MTRYQLIGDFLYYWESRDNGQVGLCCADPSLAQQSGELISGFYEVGDRGQHAIEDGSAFGRGGKVAVKLGESNTTAIRTKAVFLFAHRMILDC